jgi:hypothetical protein
MGIESGVRFRNVRLGSISRFDIEQPGHRKQTRQRSRVKRKEDSMLNLNFDFGFVGSIMALGSISIPRGV